jgi:hypothetical protein
MGCPDRTGSRSSESFRFEDFDSDTFPPALAPGFRIRSAELPAHHQAHLHFFSATTGLPDAFFSFWNFMIFRDFRILAFLKNLTRHHQ